MAERPVRRGDWPACGLSGRGVDATGKEGACSVMEQLAVRAREVRARVAAAAERAGRDPGSVAIVAVTKTIPPDVIRIAFQAGFRCFGENRVQEAQAKIAALALPGVRWELIGHLQTNKAARAVELFDRVQSVDSLRLARILDTQAASQGRTLPVLLEVNVAGEASKTGFAPEELAPAARDIARLAHLRPEGLMTVAPIAARAEDVRPVFRRLRELLRALREDVPLAQGGWEQLSMGMTDDYEVAIEEGATLVRIGRALFGERPLPGQTAGAG
jgi:pyridoxal phosphate enzyme (YggS family)